MTSSIDVENNNSSIVRNSEMSIDRIANQNFKGKNVNRISKIEQKLEN
jgi:hypothetical protein